MSIIVLVELKIKEGELQNIRPLFSRLLSETRSRSGNEGVTVHTDQDEPTSIVLIEEWATRRDYETYYHWRSERGDLTALAAFLQDAPHRRFFDHLSG